MNQFGVISRKQAFRAGMSKSAIARRLRSAQWASLYRGVYRLAGAVPSWQQALMAAYLWSDGTGVISHRAAAGLWGLDGVKPGFVEISFNAAGTPHAPAGLTVHRTGLLLPQDIAVSGPLGLTEASRTLIDLGAVVDEETLEIALDSALRKGLTSLPRLRWRLAQLKGKGTSQAGFLKQVVDERRLRGYPESALETKFLRGLRARKLPLPMRQFVVFDHGRFVGRLDFAWPDAQVNAEGDGFEFHSNRQAWERDRQRDKRLQRLGWIVYRFTWDEVDKELDKILDDIEPLLRPRLL